MSLAGLRHNLIQVFLGTWALFQHCRNEHDEQVSLTLLVPDPSAETFLWFGPLISLHIPHTPIILGYTAPLISVLGSHPKRTEPFGEAGTLPLGNTGKQRQKLAPKGIRNTYLPSVITQRPSMPQPDAGPRQQLQDAHIWVSLCSPKEGIRSIAEVTPPLVKPENRDST